MARLGLEKGGCGFAWACGQATGKMPEAQDWRSSHYPFMTDDEFAEIFGHEIAGATQVLDAFAAKVCPSCRGECCRKIVCGFYSTHLPHCPVRDRRPPKCRLYYCSKITGHQENAEIAGRMTRIIDERFSLALFFDAPITILDYDWIREFGIEEEVREIMHALESGGLDSATAEARLKDLID